MQRDVIRFGSEPQKLRLDKAPQAGIECHGQYGIDWRYTANGDTAVFYLPIEGRTALINSGAQAGDEVAIRKLSKGRWEVERISPNGWQPESRLKGYYPGNATTQAPKDPAQMRPEEIGAELRSYSRQPQPAARMTMAPKPESYEAAEPEPIREPVGEKTSREPALTYTARQLMACYHDAIETAIESQEYARNRGLGLTVSEASIKSMALTIFINECKGAAMREAS